MAAALILSADGVWIGTRFLAPVESVLPDYLKHSVIAADGGDTIVSRSITGKPVRMLKSKWTDLDERGEMQPLPMPYQFAVSQNVLGTADGDERPDIYAGVVGQAVGMVRSEETAAEIMTELVADTYSHLRRAVDMAAAPSRANRA